jgi:hypothetical protein
LLRVKLIILKVLVDENSQLLVLGEFLVARKTLLVLRSLSSEN